MANWQVGILISSGMVSKNVKSLIFSLSPWVKHMSGQHYDIRLTAENGYQAERSYSIASSPEQEGIVEFGIEYLKDGEVSPYLYELSLGDNIEMRGPIGGHFIWDNVIKGPLILIGGGSGIVPLMSILRHFVLHNDEREVLFLISARGEDYVLYKSELNDISLKNKNIKIVYTYTREIPHGWTGFTGRINEDLIKKTTGSFKLRNPRIYISGPTTFVETAANHIVKMGIDPALVKTERFGGA